MEDLAHIGKSGQHHLLADHLRKVRDRAGQYASVFSASQWAALAGQWHDLGKYHPNFQAYLRNVTQQHPHEQCEGDTALLEDAHLEDLPLDAGRSKKGGDHSTAGARHAMAVLGKENKVAARLLGYIIAGHHAGLGNWQEELEERLSTDTSKEIAKKKEDLYRTCLEKPIPQDILDAALPSLPVLQKKSRLGFSLWMRMVFSCLVDADFLDTESFMTPQQSQQRSQAPALADLKPGFDRHMTDIAARADQPLSDVNRIRAEVLAQCRQAATQPSGVFSLLVPTGGGKTLASTAFALEHALQHDKRRIIYVIPYTSIIEQTAKVLRAALGEDAVLEHHSNFDPNADQPEGNQRGDSQEHNQTRLASENWDIPVVVTTNVQFFESLFAVRTSRVRKIHNIAGSVVILDEVQQLPWNFKTPIEHCLQALVDDFGVTVLLCSATQPRLKMENVTPIIPDPQALQEKLKRVEILLPSQDAPPRNWDDLGEELARHPRVLCIVNRRADSRELFQALPQDGHAWHLSGLMCGAHRSEAIQQIKDRLEKTDLPVRVISTQLVEAGVDFSFPVVYRALGGLDAIVQAAGRCNRNGELPGLGEVRVFRPPTESPKGFLRWAEQATDKVIQLISRGKLAEDPLNVAVMDTYFSQLSGFFPSMDEKEILKDLDKDSRESYEEEPLNIAFRSAAKKFRLIDDETGYTPVVVQYGQWESKVNDLERLGPSRDRLRALQRFTVTLPQYIHAQLVKDEDIVPLCLPQRPGNSVREASLFKQQNTRLYDADKLGLQIEATHYVV